MALLSRFGRVSCPWRSGYLQ